MTTYNGHTLSEIASNIWIEVENLRFQSEECGYFGCPEVGELIYQSHDKIIDDILLEVGLTRKEFNVLISERTTPKWAFNNMLLLNEY